MGCAASSRVSAGDTNYGETSNRNRPSQLLSTFNIAASENSRSGHQLTSPNGAQNVHHHHNENVQDEARSFRSKVSAIKMLARQTSSFESFFKYLEEIGKSEYLICFRDIEEIKKLEEDQIVSRTYALVFRYKALYEDFKMSLIHSNTQNTSVNNNPSAMVLNSKHLVWDCLGKLKSLDYTNASGEIILKYLNICQNDLISRLVMPFESYLQSSYYKSWQEDQLEQEKQRNQRKTTASISSVSLISPRNSIGPHSPSINMTASNRAANEERYSTVYPDILIVDDSNITLKLTGKTLEQDGHHVEKASNGQVALQLMKSRPYDIVLIDCNMPVMDGFEAVRLFREHEKQNSNLYIPSDVSSISDSQEDPIERAAKQQNSKRNSATESFKPSVSELSAVEAKSDKEPLNVVTLKSTVADARLEHKLKRGLTAAHYHQLIIGMSSNIDEETKNRALHAGMDFFLPKPFTLQKFINTIKLSREQRKGTAVIGSIDTASTVQTLTHNIPSVTTMKSSERTHATTDLTSSNC